MISIILIQFQAMTKLTTSEYCDYVDLSDDVFAKEDDEIDPVYTKYDFRQCILHDDLPIMAYREVIHQAIHSNSVVVIEGGTGCGKSTQVPQFVLNDGFENSKRCNIIVTQPRRIAARSIAERVCCERGWNLSSVVGYQVLNRMLFLSIISNECLLPGGLG